jgi:putative nucleotidyltransferase with HDIG domain
MVDESAESDVSALVLKKIDDYKPKGGLDHTAKFFLALSAVNHKKVKGHVERVALLAEAVAAKLQKDARAAFFAGLLHDIGKIVLPANLFIDDRDITPEEYATIKEHAVAGFEILKQFHYFTAVCAGLHHALYKNGYGLSAEDFPESWTPETIKRVLEISAIVSICDFIDAYTHRRTKLKDGSDKFPGDLREMLLAKYPNDLMVVDTALEENKW